MPPTRPSSLGQETAIVKMAGLYKGGQPASGLKKFRGGGGVCQQGGPCNRQELRGVGWTWQPGPLWYVNGHRSH